MVYELPLVEVKVKPHHITTLHLVCALAFIGAGAIIAVYNYAIPLWGAALLFAGLVLLYITIARNKWATAPKTNQLLRIAELAVSLTMAIYSLVQQWKFPIGMFGALSAALVYALFWERSSGSALKITVDENGITLPENSRKKFISWPEVEQITMRFGTFTVDCLDNRLFQWTIGEMKIDTNDFEAYCNKLIQDSIGNRQNNNW
jgi:hypothetical protein